MDADVVIAGGGVIGTAIAWQAAQVGRDVTLIDPGTGEAASLVAAGMLAPVSESVFGEQDLLNLNLHAIERFPSFTAELERVTGMTAGLRTEGTLVVAYDSGDLAALDRLTAFRLSIGLKAERLDAKALRKREPFLAPNTKGGVLATGDLSVDNRRYLAALRAAARQAGVRVIPGEVTEISPGEDGPRVRLAPRRDMPEISGERAPAPGDAPALGGAPAPGDAPALGGAPALGDAPARGDTAVLAARQVVIASGHATGKIAGVPGAIRTAIRPVKGQLLRLRHPQGLPPVLTHTVRAIVGGHDVYFVPRRDGEIVVGATQEERGDRDVTAGAVHDLLRDALTAVPAVSELLLAEASAGLRPGTADNGPILGHAGASGLIFAAGHFRNGILLSAVTADAVTALLTGQRPHQAWAPFAPGRLG